MIKIHKFNIEKFNLQNQYHKNYYTCSYFKSKMNTSISELGSHNSTGQMQVKVTGDYIQSPFIAIIESVETIGDFIPSPKIET